MFGPQEPSRLTSTRTSYRSSVIQFHSTGTDQTIPHEPGGQARDSQTHQSVEGVRNFCPLPLFREHSIAFCPEAKTGDCWLLQDLKGVSKQAEVIQSTVPNPFILLSLFAIPPKDPYMLLDLKDEIEFNQHQKCYHSRPHWHWGQESFYILYSWQGSQESPFA